MIKKMGYEWRLRLVMAEHEMFQTSELVPLLAERGVSLSREQVYRLVTQPPQRMSMDTLVALCDIFQCTPNDLIKPMVTNTQVKKTASGDSGPVLPRAERRTAIPVVDGVFPRTAPRRPGTRSSATGCVTTRKTGCATGTPSSRWPTPPTANTAGKAPRSTTCGSSR